MRKFVFAAVAGVAALTVPLCSQAQESTGRFFANAGFGSTYSNVSGLTDNRDTGYDINVGYRWKDTWGIEAGYVDLGAFSFDYYNHPILRAYISGWTLGGNGKFDFADRWYMTTRVGLFFSETRVRIVPTWENISASDTNAYVGVGLGYNISKNLGVGINFNRYYAKADKIMDGTNSPYMFSANLEYRF